MLSTLIGPVSSWGLGWWGVAGAAIGCVIMIASLVLLRAGRKGHFPSPSRLTAGVSGLIVGYHVLAWSLPQGWIEFRVPLSKWWIVALGAGAAVGGSMAADRAEGRVTRV